MKTIRIIPAFLATLFFLLIACEPEKQDNKLSLSKYELEFDSNGSSQTLQIESNGHWEIQEELSWLEVSPSEGGEAVA